VSEAPWWDRLKSITLHVETDSPPMWSVRASEEYRAARLELSRAERDLRDQVEAVAARRRALPPGPLLPEYRFVAGPAELAAGDDPAPVTLLELFGEHDQLLVYHLMFHPEDEHPCLACSMWVDGLHGVHEHLGRAMAFAVITKAPLGKLRGFARRRGWSGLRLVSAHDAPEFLTDLGIEGSRGGQFPALSVFTRETVSGGRNGGGARVRHALTQCADYGDGTGRGIDLLSPVWNALDLLPCGRGEWMPDLVYRHPAAAPPAAVTRH
jgi:predicted dithiol-disulfide oxidoreductase (DUF899 family)